MLRVVLGVCGVGLIALGVFGGQALENMHRGINGIFTPDTIVMEGGSELVNPAVVDPAVVQPLVEDTELVQLAQSGNNQEESMIVLASSEGQSDQLSGTSVIDTETVVEIKAQGSEAVVPLVVPAALTEKSPMAANTTVKVLMEEANDPVLTVTADLKTAGVENVLSSTAGVPPNDTLFVLKERVNLREGPSTEHPIVLQLDIGQELMEFKRDGKWVHVGAYGTSGKIGWVHTTLVGEK